MRDRRSRKPIGFRLWVVHSLKLFPRMGAKLSKRVSFRTDYKYLIWENYVIIYKESKEYVEIYRVLNRYQDIARIFNE